MSNLSQHLDQFLAAYLRVNEPALQRRTGKALEGVTIATMQNPTLRVGAWCP